MLPVFTADEMRALDRRAIAELGIPGATLMEHAGCGAAAAILRLYPHLVASRRPVVIVCGKGGNAGDGFVVARDLAARRVPVRVILTTPPGDVSGDAAEKLQALHRTVVRPLFLEDPARVAEALRGAALVVDALLGTGARGVPEGRLARIIETINASGGTVVALDIPSGLPADGGVPAGPVIRATVTLTFAGLKRGLVEGPGAGVAGRVEVIAIGIPDHEVRRGVTVFLLERGDVAQAFPPRPRETHKGDYGRLLVVAGSLGKTGAAALAARAAMRSGAGLVTVASPVSQQPVVAALTLESMTEALPETAARTIALDALPTLRDLARGMGAVAVGPGLGLDAETAEVTRALTTHLGQPVVIDADALTALAGHLDRLPAAPAARCLTPHPGEMARLLGTFVAAVQRDRIGTAREFATRWRAHVVLKGASSVIAAPDGSIVLNPTGNPGMASGGMGDVLTGMVGAFLARGMDPRAALQCAVYLHGSAADIAAARLGQESLIARDVIAALPDAFLALRQAPVNAPS